MFFDPYNNSYSRLTPSTSYARILHAIPDAPGVDVYLNNKIVARNLRYSNFTEYLKLAPGHYDVQIFKAGSRRDLLLKETLFVNPSSIYTLAAIGYMSSSSLLPILEPKGPLIPGKLFIRFGHLSPNSPNVDLTLNDGKKLFTNVPYKKVTGYTTLNPGIYNFNLRDSKSGDLVLNIPNINLKAERFYSIYAIGLLGGAPPLQVVIPLDGNSYLSF